MAMASAMSVLLPTSPSRNARGFPPKSAIAHHRVSYSLPRCPVPESRSLLSSSHSHSTHAGQGRWAYLPVKASVGSAQFVVEPETSVEFQTDLTVPGCGNAMVLLGTGYREKVFAIIAVKVYAAGFYVEPSFSEVLSPWKGRSAAEISGDYSVFRSIFEGPFKKSLKIALVREVDGKTFWNALSDVISPRIKEPTATDESSLKTFRATFESRSLTKGTVIHLTWDEPSKLLVSIASNGPPSAVDATIESMNVTFALFDAFFCDQPVSPTLKASVAEGLEAVINT